MHEREKSVIAAFVQQRELLLRERQEEVCRKKVHRISTLEGSCKVRFLTYDLQDIQPHLMSSAAGVCMNPPVRAGSYECVLGDAIVLILDVAAGKESLWRVTEQLIITHSAPHTVERKRRSKEEGGKREEGQNTAGYRWR